MIHTLVEWLRSLSWVELGLLWVVLAFVAAFVWGTFARFGDEAVPITNSSKSQFGDLSKLPFDLLDDDEGGTLANAANPLTTAPKTAVIEQDAA